MDPDRRDIEAILASLEAADTAAIEAKARQGAAEAEALERAASTDAIIAANTIEFISELQEGYSIEARQRLGVFGRLFNRHVALERVRNRRIFRIPHIPYELRDSSRSRQITENGLAFVVPDQQIELVDGYEFRHNWQFVTSAPRGIRLGNYEKGTICDLDITRSTTELHSGTTTSSLYYHIRTWSASELAKFVAREGDRELENLEIEGQGSKLQALGLIKNARMELAEHLSTKKR